MAFRAKSPSGRPHKRKIVRLGASNDSTDLATLNDHIATLEVTVKRLDDKRAQNEAKLKELQAKVQECRKLDIELKESLQDKKKELDRLRNKLYKGIKRKGEERRETWLDDDDECVHVREADIQAETFNSRFLGRTKDEKIAPTLIKEPSIFSEEMRHSLIFCRPDRRLSIGSSLSKLQGFTIEGPQDPVKEAPEGLAGKYFGKTISTYPQYHGKPTREGDPIADSYSLEVYQNGIVLVAVADGCSWGNAPRDAAMLAKRVFLNHLGKVIRDFKTTRGAAGFLLDGLSLAHHAILAQHPGEYFRCGTTTLVGGYLVRQANHEWIFHCISIGDCKVYHYATAKNVVVDITQNNRQNFTNARDCGGRIGPYKNGKADLRNVLFFETECDEGDFIFLMSDGVHDNLDPQTLGFTPEDLGMAGDMTWKEAENEPGSKEKKAVFMTTLFHDIVLPKGATPNAHEMVTRILDYSHTTTDSSRVWMQANPNQRLPSDYTKFPGKLDHTTCVCFQVGSAYSFPPSFKKKRNL